ncbi:hypothetical protein [Candidatus Berkiella aquae]|uniref:MC/SLC25 family protein n=1 Tax=Candidatus Berkiella aquae TaxID=295108 RepID=A0A0Q9YLH6_9GAMM|nr:hypothetical protein [Candidatus Berkiella aquae]MCS5711502.1 MC/SLC25 family protein [Candidatus Berkiella aquae]
MQHGPSAQSQSSSLPEYRHTYFSKLFGAGSGAFIEQGIFHGLDTASKNAMAHNQPVLPWFRGLVQQEGILGATKRLYAGFGIGLLKKAPMRSYKYGVQDALNDYLTREYGAAFERTFGVYGVVAIQALAGATTGAFEPWFFQPIDTLQIRKQALKEKVSFENAKKLGVRNLYRASLFTGMFRNVPGSIGLFGGSEFANAMMDNQDHHSNAKNLLAKWGGAFLSLILSQPGDVVKTKMQVHQKGFLPTLKDVTVKELVTSGLSARLLMSAKVGVGFLVIEKTMSASKRLFGEEVKLSRVSSMDEDSIVAAVFNSSSESFVPGFEGGERQVGERLVDQDATHEQIDELTEKMKKVRM